MWQIEDSLDAQPIPISWNHKVAVPGLAHSAEPAFPQVVTRKKMGRRFRRRNM
jgi:hypothetical protein